MDTAYRLRWIVTAAFLLLPAAAFTQQTIPPDREALLKGLGMGLAEIAEINNYPGPKHTLDLRNELGLTRDQVKKTEALDKVVASAALAKGEEIVLAEEELSKLFEAGTISEQGTHRELLSQNGLYAKLYGVRQSHA